MFLSSSSSIYPGVSLLTLGATCRYIVQSDDSSFLLSDPGASVHIPALLERLKRLSLNPGNITRVVITHLDADRIAGLALLRRHAPRLKLIGSPQMAKRLKTADFMHELWMQDQSFTEFFPHQAGHNIVVELPEFTQALQIDQELSDGTSIALGDDREICCLWTPGHTSLSLTYCLAPSGLAIVDETFGYYRYREVPAFGADYNLERALVSIAKLKARNVSALGLPYLGVLTGELCHRYLQALEEAYKDLPLEFKAASKRGLSRDSILQELHSTIFSDSANDPFLAKSLQKSLRAVIGQL